MIGVIQVHIHIKILHSYENEVAYDVYKKSCRKFHSPDE